jgi:hypothetical protein
MEKLGSLKRKRKYSKNKAKQNFENLLATGE